MVSSCRGHQEKLLSFGPYRLNSLRDARDHRDEARQRLLNQMDPAADKKRKEVATALQAASTATTIWSMRSGSHPGNGQRLWFAPDGRCGASYKRI
ncbi:integrase arm-type DNA-binding domain-containing protein [Asticcacaulis sp.]|uniref:integrase arm-type DNA-binding domain-containing protein n=1 Tax=Asticcacaulis sp. TaxID=1872648 RepID=UPI0039C887C6